MNPISPKVTAGGAAGALSLILVWVASLFGLDIPAEVGVAFTTIITTIVAWFVPDPLRAAILAQQASRDVLEDESRE